jgi:hypothetical protein
MPVCGVLIRSSYAGSLKTALALQMKALRPVPMFYSLARGMAIIFKRLMLFFGSNAAVDGDGS